jgi:hypothetical protein
MHLVDALVEKSRLPALFRTVLLLNSAGSSLMGSTLWITISERPATLFAS